MLLSCYEKILRRGNAEPTGSEEETEAYKKRIPNLGSNVIPTPAVRWPDRSNRQIIKQQFVPDCVVGMVCHVWV